MTAIIAIFDGKAFVPQQSISLPTQSQVIVYIDQVDAQATARLNDQLRAYYTAKPDDSDEDWASAIAPGSARAWDED
jgi:hypothetical protein